LNSRELAVKILVQSETSNQHIDTILHQKFAGWQGDDRDKRFVHELVLGVIRWQRKLDFYLSKQYRGQYHKVEHQVRALLRVGLYQLLLMDSVPAHAALNETVELAKNFRNKKVAGLINGVLRGVKRNWDALNKQIDKMSPVERLSIRESHPEWLVERWVERYGGGQATALCQWNNRTPSVTIRVNITAIPVEQFCKKLDELNIEYAPSKYLPEFLILEQAQEVLQNSKIKPVWYAVQDQAAGIAPSLVKPDRDDLVIDTCAAPGGKATYLAQKYPGEKILAYDVDPKRLKKVESLAQRLHLENVKTGVADATSFQYSEANWFLIDAPCTGTGVLGKRADARWNREPGDPEKMAELQLKILNNVCQFCPVDGYIVYSTCTLEPEENWDVIDRFLEQNPHFDVTDIQNDVEKKFLDSRGGLMILPQEHQMDGAFAVRLQRKM